MWLHAAYEPVSAFGLRPSNTTSSGGKSLLVPTPYAMKMGMLDRMIRHWGLSFGEEYFPFIRDMSILVRVPERVSVNRTFQRILRPDGKRWKETIVQREYCFHNGTFDFALGWIQSNPELNDVLPDILMSINYFGRKGSFMQCVDVKPLAKPPTDYVQLTFSDGVPLPMQMGFLQRMDDMDKQATFVDISPFQKGKADGGRVNYNVILPYRLDFHGFNHTVYCRETP